MSGGDFVLPKIGGVLSWGLLSGGILSRGEFVMDSADIGLNSSFINFAKSALGQC